MSVFRGFLVSIFSHSECILRDTEIPRSPKLVPIASLMSPVSKKKKKLRLTPVDVPTLQILCIIGLNDVEILILTIILSKFSKSEMSFTYFLKKDTINVLIENYV